MRNDEALSLFPDHLHAAGRSLRTVAACIRRSPVQAADLGDRWDSVTPIDLAEWRRRRAASVEPATVNLEVDAVRQFYRWAVGEGLLAVDPTTRLRHLPEG